jgi:hypothetical protein
VKIDFVNDDAVSSACHFTLCHPCVAFIPISRRAIWGASKATSLEVCKTSCWGNGIQRTLHPLFHMNQTPLSSAGIVCAMAPSAQAAIAVGGDTLQGACFFPRTVGNFRLKDEALELNGDALSKLQRKHAFSEYYFVDEFGMMGAEQFGVVEERLRHEHPV